MGNTLGTESLLSRPSARTAHEAREIASIKAEKRFDSNRRQLQAQYRSHRKYVLCAIKNCTRQGYFSAHYWLLNYQYEHFYNAEVTLRKYLVTPLRTELQPLGYSVRLVQCEHGDLGVKVSWQKGKTQ